MTYFFQPYKYLHLLRLLETGHATRAQDYTRALAEYVTDSVSGRVGQSTSCVSGDSSTQQS